MPKSKLATALPSSWPGYQTSAAAGTLLSYGIRTGPPSFSTTIVRGLAAATAAGFFHGAFQPHLDQMQHAPINNPARYRFLIRAS
jgi:hypothetical protein